MISSVKLKKKISKENYFFYSAGGSSQIVEKGLSNYNAMAFLRLFITKILKNLTCYK